MTTHATTNFLRWAVAIAGLFALPACHSGEDPPVTPQQGAVLFVHGDHQLTGNKIQFALDDASAGELSYGQGGTYLPFTIGLHTVKMTAGTAATGTGAIKLDADKLYSYFATPATTASNIGSRVTTDDLTRPAAGRVRIRLVSLLTNAGNNIELAQPPASGTTYQHVAYDADAFGDFTPVNANLVVRTDAGQVLAQVGSGVGTGTGSKKYEDGHIYTVVAVGDPTATNPDARPRAYVLTNL